MSYSRLARLKAEAKRKREEQEITEKRRVLERERRMKLLKEQFLDWNVGLGGKVEVALVSLFFSGRDGAPGGPGAFAALQKNSCFHFKRCFLQNIY